MTDIKDVMKGLYCCGRSGQTVKKKLCDECPYKGKGVMNAFTIWKTCRNYLVEDALYALQKHHSDIKIDDLFSPN